MPGSSDSDSRRKSVRQIAANVFRLPFGTPRTSRKVDAISRLVQNRSGYPIGVSTAPGNLIRLDDKR